MKTNISDKLNRMIESPINLSRILDNLQEGIIAHDLNRNIFFFNKSAEKITGYTRAEILDQDCHEAFGAPFCSADCSFCGESVPPTDMTKKALTITTKSGEQRRVEMTVTNMLDENDAPFGVLVSFKDLTDLINLQIKAGDIRSFANIIGQDIKMLRSSSRSRTFQPMITRCTSSVKPAPVKNWWPRRFIPKAPAPAGRSCRSIAVPCRRP